MRESLRLDAHELSVTREEIQNFLLGILVGLTSVAIAVLGGEGAVPWAGYVYLLIFPLLRINGYVMGSRRRRRESGAHGERGAGREESEEP